MNLANKRFTTKYSALAERLQKRLINSNNVYERYEMCMKHHISPILSQNFGTQNTTKHRLDHICSCQSTKHNLKDEYQKEYRVSFQQALRHTTDDTAKHTAIPFEVNGEPFNFKLMMLSTDQLQRQYPPNTTTHSVCSIAGTYTSIIWDLNANYCLEIRLMHKCQKSLKLNKKTTQQKADTIAKFWYESVWGAYGFDGSNLFVGIHDNPFVGDVRDNLRRVLMVLHKKKRDNTQTEFKINGYLIRKIINTGTYREASSSEEMERRSLEKQEFSVPPLVEVDTTKKRKRRRNEWDTQREMNALRALNISLVSITRELYDKLQRMKSINEDLTSAANRNASMKDRIQTLEEALREEQQKMGELQQKLEDEREREESVNALLDEQHRMIEELSKSEEFWRNKRFEEICERHVCIENTWGEDAGMPPRKRQRIMDEECNVNNSVFSCMGFNGDYDECLFSSESDAKCVDFNHDTIYI